MCPPLKCLPSHWSVLLVNLSWNSLFQLPTNCPQNRLRKRGCLPPAPIKPAATYGLALRGDAGTASLPGSRASRSDWTWVWARKWRTLFWKRKTPRLATVIVSCLIPRQKAEPPRTCSISPLQTCCFTVVNRAFFCHWWFSSYIHLWLVPLCWGWGAMRRDGSGGP